MKKEDRIKLAIFVMIATITLVLTRIGILIIENLAK